MQLDMHSGADVTHKTEADLVAKETVLLAGIMCGYRALTAYKEQQLNLPR